ncbi:hypothetical protein [Mucilaginibacter terrae]|uniref:DUF5117 domain-containing protein n=1 Tax=Mucilaginibacter terrae TaxID=1955052 RepID=A0ABU3GZ24_9SPHI|nr:hypothetical protein [Mucilaginibacter terrae]MDT3405015.1 hypothetical protein [Mucilaginibacter terrae]
MIFYRHFTVSVRLMLMLATGLFCFSCTQKTPPKDLAVQGTSPESKHERISFKPIEGIAYTEIRREYENGLGFHQQGYHLQPEWRVTFLPGKDSVRIFSLVLQRFINDGIIFDHDSVVNVAHSWLKIKQLHPDSMKFQVLYVRNKHIMDTTGQIYMTLYSNNYIKNKLHTTVQELQKPPRRDTLFIQKRVRESIADMKKHAFAATEPVTFTSRVPQVTVSQKILKKDDALKDATLADNYLLPEFDITIHKAYADFYHSMQLFVDQNGKLHFDKPTIGIYDEVEHRIKIMKGVVDGYLTAYLSTTPGKTLGMAHPSIIKVNVKGIQD